MELAEAAGRSSHYKLLWDLDSLQNNQFSNISALMSEFLGRDS